MIVKVAGIYSVDFQSSWYVQLPFGFKGLRELVSEELGWER
jgi:hypothetical protein